MSQTEALRTFLEAYKEYIVDVLEPSRRELKAVLAEWTDTEYWQAESNLHLPTPSPVQRIYTRIKRPESVVDKILRKPSSYPESFVPSSFKTMGDTIGARIIVYFLSNLPDIDRAVSGSGLFEVSADDPPVVYLPAELRTRFGLAHLRLGTKESGYASVHYVMRLRNSAIAPQERPWFEIQVRTLAEDTWGQVEHLLGYKPDKRTSFAVRKQFQLISRQLAVIDEHFNFLYEELSRFQTEAPTRELNDRDAINAENLPLILSEAAIRCAQDEIDALLKVLASRGVETVGQLRSVSIDRNLDTVRNTYRREVGRPPDNFEMVANLANLHAVENESELGERVVAQIQFARVWDEIKKILSGNSEPVDSVSRFMHTAPSRQQNRGRKPAQRSDLEAFRSAAGSWKDMDTEKLVSQLRSDREIPTRAPVDI